MYVVCLFVNQLRNDCYPQRTLQYCDTSSHSNEKQRTIMQLGWILFCSFLVLYHRFSKGGRKTVISHTDYIINHRFKFESLQSSLLCT
jgi:hypothetical protein